MRRRRHATKTPAEESCGNVGTMESVENQKQVSHFPTATNICLKNKRRGRGRASPSARRRVLRTN